MSAALPVSIVLNQPTPKVSADSVDLSKNAGTSQGGLRSDEILRGQKAVEITHNGSIYRLQATRLGKLILTK